MLLKPMLEHMSIQKFMNTKFIRFNVQKVGLSIMSVLIGTLLFFRPVFAYNYDSLGMWACMEWLYTYGFDTIEPTVSTTISTPTISIYPSSSWTSLTLEVYDSDGDTLGNYTGYDSDSNIIKYVSIAGVYSSCTTCYVGAVSDNSTYYLSSATLTSTSTEEFYPMLTPSGSTANPTSYSDSSVYWDSTYDTIVVSFWGTRNLNWTKSDWTVYSKYDYTYTITRVPPIQLYIDSSSSGRVIRNTFLITQEEGASDQFSISWGTGMTGNDFVMPIYFGLLSDMTQDQKAFTGVGDDVSAIRELLEDYISPTDESEAAGDAVDSASSDLDTVSDNLHSFEESTITDMNSQFSDIDTTGDGLSLISDNNFLNSANWVRTQFNRLITDNVFGLLIYFSLVLGLALLVVGKLRK